MDLVKMIAELREEHQAVVEAIQVLERLAGSQKKRRGRPPAWLSIVHANTAAPKQRNLSPEARKKMSDAQKRRWAAYRKNNK